MLVGHRQEQADRTRDDVDGNLCSGAIVLVERRVNRFDRFDEKRPEPIAQLVARIDGVRARQAGDLLARNHGQVSERFAGVVHESGFAVLRAHRGAVLSVAFSNDGKFVFSASEDGSVRRWQMEQVHFVPRDRDALRVWMKQQTTATLPPTETAGSTTQ
jgi:hypothetical protein